MNRKVEVTLAWTLLIGSLIGWPFSAFTWASNEPQFILGLSWLAKNARAHKDMEG